MRFWIPSLLVVSMLAGCAAEPVQDTSDDEDTFEGIEAEATDDTGIIRGVVVDPAVVPLAEVTVTVEGQDMSAVTNENGAFAFGGLAPGSYFLSASKVGYQAIQANAAVEAGVSDPPAIRIQMTPDPSTLPFAQPLVFDAYIQCSESVILVGYAGGCDNDFLVDYDQAILGRTPDAAQSELIWDSTQPLGDWMTLLYSAPGEGTLLHNYQDEEGPSPVKVFANKTLMEENGVVADYPLQVRVFNSGLEGTDIGRDYGDPIDGDDCVERPQLGGCTTGLGLTVDQILTVYTHAFYNTMPPEDWRFSEHGEPPV